MNITQDMYNVTLQQHRTIHIRVELLNYQFIVVNQLGGVVLDGSISEDANSDVRKTCNITMCVKSGDFDVATGGQIWLDKYIRIYVGIENIRSDEIVWFNKGTYLINQPSLEYDAETYTLSFQGVDLMSKLTGMRNGNVDAKPTLIDVDTNTREVIVSLLEMGGFNKYVISLEKQAEKIPIELSFDAGGTIYDILSKIRDIWVNYQMYFDIDGVFHFEKIPNGEDDVVKITNETFDRLCISHNDTTDFESVKNVIEILGTTHEPSYYSPTVSVSGSQVNLTITSYTSADYNIIGFSVPEGVTLPTENTTIKINSLAAVPLVNEAGESVVIPTEEDNYWVIQAVFKNNALSNYKFLGHLQAYAYIEDDNPESPFYVGSSVGKIRTVLSGGDYETIYSDELAYERAKFELYQMARLNDSVSIETVPIYYIEAYDLIEFKLSNNKEAYKYLVQSINTDLSESGNQTITASRFYPYYPTI